MSHLRFVVHIARSYSGYGLAEADLIQEGNVGLMKAVKRFNPEKGVRLVSFAVHWIKAEMHEFILRNWRIVKVATTKAQRKLFFNLRSAKKSLSWLSCRRGPGGRRMTSGVDVQGSAPYGGPTEQPRCGPYDSQPLDSDDDDKQLAGAPVLTWKTRAADPGPDWWRPAIGRAGQRSSACTAPSAELDERSQGYPGPALAGGGEGDPARAGRPSTSVSAERIRQLGAECHEENCADPCWPEPSIAGLASLL